MQTKLIYGLLFAALAACVVANTVFVPLQRRERSTREKVFRNSLIKNGLYGNAVTSKFRVQSSVDPFKNYDDVRTASRAEN